MHGAITPRAALEACPQETETGAIAVVRSRCSSRVPSAIISVTSRLRISFAVSARNWPQASFRLLARGAEVVHQPSALQKVAGLSAAVELLEPRTDAISQQGMLPIHLAEAPVAARSGVPTNCDYPASSEERLQPAAMTICPSRMRRASR